MFALSILAVPAEIKANGAFNIRRLGMAALGLDWPEPLEFCTFFIRTSVGIKSAELLYNNRQCDSRKWPKQLFSLFSGHLQSIRLFAASNRNEQKRTAITA